MILSLVKMHGTAVHGTSGPSRGSPDRRWKGSALRPERPRLNPEHHASRKADPDMMMVAP